ncbi:MAG: F0F1 ATP synthase subunit delta [Mariprofundaceae bacterium]
MGSQVVSRRYARALFELRQEGKDLRDGVAALAEAVKIPDVAAMLDAPGVPAERKAEALTKAVGIDAPELRRLVEILCRRGKAALLPEIHELFEAMVREAQAEAEATVAAPIDLDESLRKRIAGALEKHLGRKVRLSTEKDERLLGGLVIRVGDRMIDLSVRSRLEAMRRAMAAG